MRILVSGGAGFIGSHVAEAYLTQGHRVSIVDDLSSGKEENIPSGAAFYSLDILDPQLEQVFSRERPEVVNHHAAQIDVRKSVQDPLWDAQVNVMGTLSLLKWAQKYGSHLVIFASSGGTIYGEEGTLPFSEESPPNPQSPYGLSKSVGESYLKLYWTLFGLNSIVLRYSNVYGPRQDPKGEAGVVAIFCADILHGKSLTVFGDGTQTRDYVYVSDVTEANLLALRLRGQHVLNIGTGIETSVSDLILSFEEILDRTLSRRNAPPRQGELARSCLAIRKAEKELGWTPKIALRDGLRKTFCWSQSCRGMSG